MAAVGVCILAFGTDRVGAVLGDVLADGVAPEQVLVVHNPRAAGEPAPAAPSGVEVLRMARNEGYAPAMNAALRRRMAAGDELVLLLTHDARLPRGGLAALVAAAERNPRFGVLGPLQRWTALDRRLSHGGGLGPDGVTFHHTAPRPVPEDPLLSEAEWIDGAALLVRTDALRQAGLFDERFFLYFEETELCLRVRRAGWQVGTALDVEITSDPGAAKRPGAFAYLMTRNGLAFARAATGSARPTFWRSARWVASHARRTVWPDADGRAHHAAAAIGTAAGMVAWMGGRWGRPPRWLPGQGDVKG